jgi:hypothetical protein
MEVGMKIKPIDCKFSSFEDVYDYETNEEHPYCRCEINKNKIDFCVCHYGCDWANYAYTEHECDKLDAKNN